MPDENKHLDATPENNNLDDQPVVDTSEISDDTTPKTSVELSVEDDNELDDPIDNTLETLNELNLSIEDETMAVDIIREDDLETSSENDIEQDVSIQSNDEDDEVDSLNIMVEAATEPISALSDDDRALLDDATASNADDEDEEIVVKDFLHEDDGEPLGTPDYLKPPEPEWKVVARQLREEKEEKRRALLARKREDDKRISEEYDARLKEREQVRKKQEAQFRQERQKIEQEKKNAVDEMMQRIRDERERKQQDRAEVDEKEFGRKFTYPKPPTRSSYPKPSETKRMEREQPKNEVELTDTNKPSPPIKEQAKPNPKPPKKDDFENRISRLSKPDTPSDTKVDDKSDSDDSNPSE